ncbi:MAG: CAP domain-containing protein [Turneriella sp.]
MNKKTILLLAITLSGIIALSARTLRQDRATYLSKLENEILQEMNLARTAPQTYAKLLEDYRNTFEGNLVKRPGQPDLQTNEGTSAVDEAIGFLKKQEALGALRPSKGMSKAAKDHVRDQGPTGQVGHVGTNGSDIETRLNRHGKWDIRIAENISYGMKTGRSVVIQLIVDDGLPKRGHRDNIFEAKFQRAGIACGPHKVYGIMCVQTFAGEYNEK